MSFAVGIMFGDTVDVMVEKNPYPIRQSSVYPAVYPKFGSFVPLLPLSIPPTITRRIVLP